MGATAGGRRETSPRAAFRVGAGLARRPRHQRGRRSRTPRGMGDPDGLEQRGLLRAASGRGVCARGGSLVVSERRPDAAPGEQHRSRAVLSGSLRARPPARGGRAAAVERRCRRAHGTVPPAQQVRHQRAAPEPPLSRRSGCRPSCNAPTTSSAPTSGGPRRCAVRRCSTRAARCAWLAGQGYESIGILGTSLGSCLSMLTAAHEPLIRAAALNHISPYFADVVWEGLSTTHVREGLDGQDRSRDAAADLDAHLAVPVPGARPRQAHAARVRAVRSDLSGRALEVPGERVPAARHRRTSWWCCRAATTAPASRRSSGSTGSCCAGF